MSRAGRWLSRAALLSLLALPLGAASPANAAMPVVTITSPPSGEETPATPSFTGTGEEGANPVTLRIYAGKSASGKATQALSSGPVLLGGGWEAGPAATLANGTYTAQASQTNAASETGESAPVTFKVDTPPPKVTLNIPESPSTNATPTFTGTATGASTVSVQIYAGSTASGAAISAATAVPTGGPWTSNQASPRLPAGAYTAVASQEASVEGNKPGESKPVNFTVLATPPASTSASGPLSPRSPPLASFRWFPPVPQTGEAVSLVSTSSDATSAITALAWSFTSTSPFQPAGTVVTTSFASPGAHVIRLLVTNAYGLSSTAAETINVVGPKVSLMQPYPVVRLAGSETRSGVRLRLLEVQQLPVGAHITVRCKAGGTPSRRARTGRGCPARLASRVAAANRQGDTAVSFRAFERVLGVGVTLEILVSAPGEIGKYTRFTVRRGRLPLRVDMCLDPTGVKPIACPAS